MNKKLIITGTVVAVLAITTALVWPRQTCDAKSGSCQSSQPKAIKTSRANVISAELAKSTATLIDVREPSEFADGHAKGATNIPLGDIQAKKYTGNRDIKIYVYCHSGRRAGLAMTALQQQGYTQVESIGGLGDWQSVGGSIVR